MIYLLAVGAGMLFPLGMAPLHLWPLSILSVAICFGLISRSDARPGLLAWCYGLGKYGVGASWVYVSIHEFGGASPLLAGSLVALFVAFVSLLFCLPLGIAFGRLRPGANPLVLAAAFVGLWLLVDWLTTWFLTGFPWLLAGYVTLDSPLAGWVPVLGALGAGLMILLTAVLPIVAWRSAGRTGYAAAGVAIVVIWSLGWGLSMVAWTERDGEHSVALVQGNLDQATKWNRDQVGPNVRRHLALSADAWDADLLIWPEASITMFARQAETLLEDLAEQSRASDTTLIVGIPTFREREDGGLSFQNTALALGLGRGRFVKHHLVPFGEYVPFESVLRGAIEFFDLPMSRNAPGARSQNNITSPFGELALAICYEIAYPGTMREKASTAAALVTISNDTWFGDSLGPPQHMHLARMRALENGRWLLRATNNGITGIVDAGGRLVERLPREVAATLEGRFEARSGMTPFGTLGHWPALLVAFLLVGGAAIARRR